MLIFYFLCLLALIINELGLGDKDKIDLLWPYWYLHVFLFQKQESSCYLSS